MISLQCEIDVTEAIDCAFELLAIERMDAHIQEQLESGELDHEFAAALVDHQWIGRGVRLPEWVTLMRTLGPGSRPVEHMWKAAFAKLDTDSSGALPKDQFAKVFKWCAYGCRQHSTHQHPTALTSTAPISTARTSTHQHPSWQRCLGSVRSAANIVTCDLCY